MSKRLRTRTADLYWPYHVLSCSEIKTQGKRKEGGWSWLWCSLCGQRPCLSGSDQTSASFSERISFFALLKYQAFAFPIKLSLSQSMSMLAFCYCIPWEKGVSKMLGWCFAIGWGQPTIGALQLEWLWFYDISLHVFLTLSIGFKKHFITLLGRSYSLKNLDCHKLSQVLGFFYVKSMTTFVLANIPGGPQINKYHKPRIYRFIFLSLPSVLTEKWERDNFKEVEAKLRRMIIWHTILHTLCGYVWILTCLKYVKHFYSCGCSQKIAEQLL